MTILHVDSSINGDGSMSRALSHAVVAHLAALSPSQTVVRRNLAAEPLPHLARAGVENAPVLEEFLAARTIVVGAPMYNFGIPSQLKAWLDHLAVPGKTFRYGAQGPEGLCGGRRLIVVSTRGGIFSAGSPYAAFDHQEGHLQAFFRFLGITDITVIRAEGLAMGEEAQQRSVEAAKAQIQTLAA
ncbi:FMN-dependent NADH-azoreductase [Azospirillum sp. TSH100]|uniref:FMN-dependent NADH-azoreductase n=1 Tax=Azospirillum sp. TSH100 TaxID=652764 RepID=UPI000D61BD91|nr:NAD(P)H-dependent oxidoreductase [Azospirillum sp. TSH100]PWC88134.1 FMN-dependent NADH-azoreductase [Azospirillum sp. TSH100]QCG92114.1 FMN-dependent NADH-azoreductase [Azospirillum sp. TSH100]